MKTADVCFLWHMHQPYYTDRVAGTAGMPWVRLHATKAYFDMAALLERFPGIRATFNFTPSLLLQLEELASGSVTDLFLQYAKRPAADLSLVEQAFLLRHFFAANWATMVRPYPRYHELLVKRGLNVQGQELERVARHFSTQEFLDLQVWHNLAWFGYGAAARHPRIAALRLKDRGFTEDQKHEVLALQRQVVTDVIPLYRRLAERGQIELTTTPFYHPILPLLIDTDIARRCQPDATLPTRFQAPADAEAHLRRAVALHTSVFGGPPQGLWPAEGSVCPEMIPLVRRAGLSWMATDEGVLARSLSHWNRRDDLYRPYRVGHAGHDVAVVFRDRELSDAFGFVYSKWTPESAVEDVLHRLTSIVEHTGDEHPLIAVILDGENPWEHYHDGGERFLAGLYTAFKTGLQTSGHCLMTGTVSASLGRRPPVTQLSHLHSGSWINADYKIWIGHPEDNRGWELVRETRARLVELAPRVTSEQAERAWDELYAAEGSDWFWWYGDDFQTDFKPEFDHLFRIHLRNVFLRLGQPVPDYVHEPVIAVHGPADAQSVRLPVRLLSPTLDGLVTDFFEWRGAGSIDPSPPLGSMWRASDLFTFLGFGYNGEALYIRLDVKDGIRDDLDVEVHVAGGGQQFKAVFPLTRHGIEQFTLWRREGDTDRAMGVYRSIAKRKVIELSLPFKDLGLQPGQPFTLAVVVTEQGREIERYPRHQAVTVEVPDHNFEARMWRV